MARRGGMMINLPPQDNQEPLSTRSGMPPGSAMYPPSTTSGGGGGALRSASNTSPRRSSVFRYNDSERMGGSTTRYDPAFGNLAASTYEDRDVMARSLREEPRVFQRSTDSLGGRAPLYSDPRGSSRSPREEGRTRTPQRGAPVDQSVVVSPETDEDFTPRIRTRSRRDADAVPSGSPTRSRSNLGASFRERASNAVESPMVRSTAGSEAGFAPRISTPKRRAGAASVASSVSAANRVQPFRRDDGPAPAHHTRQETQAYQEERYNPPPNNQGNTRAVQPQVTDGPAAARNRNESSAAATAAAARPVVPPLQRVESRRYLNAGGPSARAESVHNSPRQVTPTTPKGVTEGIDREFLRERLTATNRELHGLGFKLKKREAEILKLRAALHRVYDAASKAGANVPQLDESVLLPGAPPPHAAGLTLLPVPLALKKPVIQQHGYLDVLDVESRIFTSRKWKRRYVVADDRGVYCFRTEQDFATNAFHKVKEVLLYRQCEHFVPNIANALERLPQDDSLSDAERRLMLHPAASEMNRLFFGFVTRQPPGLPTSEPINPPLLLRTESIQEHEDWVHFLARMFNTQLYRDSFPQLFGALEISDDDEAQQNNPITEDQRQAPLPNPPDATPAAATAERENPLEDDGGEAVDTDDDTVRDLGLDPSSDMTTPMPPRNPPPDDALSARRPGQDFGVAEAETQTDITVSRRRGEGLRVIGRQNTVDAGVGDGCIEEDEPSPSRNTQQPFMRTTESVSPIIDPMPPTAVPPLSRLPMNGASEATQSDAILAPETLAALGGFESVDALVSALTHSVPPRRLASPNSLQTTSDGVQTTDARGRSPLRRRSGTDENAATNNDVFTVASLQAEMMSLRHDLSANEATRSAQQEAITALNTLVKNLEDELSHLRGDYASAEANVKSLSEVNDLAEKDLERMRVALSQARRSGSVEGSVTLTPPRQGSSTPPPPPPELHDTNMDRRSGETRKKKHSPIQHARMLAQGSRRRRQYADGWSDERHHKSFTPRVRHGRHDDHSDDDAQSWSEESDRTYTDGSRSYSNEDALSRTASQLSSDLEDLDFECDDCREMYRELTRVVDERDGLMREIARRHHEYTDGIAQMCERVIDDMDQLYDRYREEQMQLVAGGGDLSGGVPGGLGLPLSMLRIDASNPRSDDGGDVPFRQRASALDGFSVTCAVDEKRVKLLSARADKKRPGSAMPSSYAWKLEDLVTGAVMSLLVDVAPKAVGLGKKSAVASKYGYSGGANLAARPSTSVRSSNKLVMRGPQVEVAIPPRVATGQPTNRREHIIPHALSPN